jgi:hypothetical protein
MDPDDVPSGVEHLDTLTRQPDTTTRSDLNRKASAFTPQPKGPLVWTAAPSGRTGTSST